MAPSTAGVGHTLAVIKLELLFGIATFALWVFCLVDAIGAQSGRIRNLPKVAWILLILFFPLIGSIAWLVAGRPESKPSRPSEFPEYDRPGRAAPAEPEQDAEFLRQVRERAEAQRKQYDEQRKREREADGTADGG